MGLEFGYVDLESLQPCREGRWRQAEYRRRTEWPGDATLSFNQSALDQRSFMIRHLPSQGAEGRILPEPGAEQELFLNRENLAGRNDHGCINDIS